MERVETLASRIARDGALNEAEAAGWIIRLAKELEPIHSLGVAHGNITAEALRIEGSPQTSRGFLADAGRVPNLVAYHSPERAGGEGISPANDTWAVAVVLYLALTGSLPFPGADDHEVKRRILGAPPSPLAVFDVGDDDLQQILDRAFSRDPATRLLSLGELRKALEEWHPDPGAKQLPRLDVADKEAPGSAPSPGSGRSALTAAELAEDDDDGDGPTMVRHVSSFQDYLDPPRSQPAPTSQPAPRSQPGPKSQPLQRERAGVLKGRSVPTPSRPLPVPEPPPRRRTESAVVDLLAFDHENEPATAILQSPFSPPTQRPPPPLPTPITPSLAAPIQSVSIPTAPLQPTPLQPTPLRPTPLQPTPLQPTPLPAMAVPPSRSEPLSAPQIPSSAVPAAAGMFPVEPAHPVAAAHPVAPAHPVAAVLPVAVALPVALAHSIAAAAPPPGGLVEALPSEPAQPREPQAGRLSKPLLGGLALLLVCGAAAFFLLRPSPTSAPGAPGAPSAAPSAAAVAPSASSAAASATPSAAVTATASPSAAASVSPSAEASASPSAASSASPSASPAVCLMPLFAPGTFVDPPTRLDGICKINDPRKGGDAVRTEVVRSGAGRSVSDGMREWGVLGLYEMAVFELLRATCCTGAPPLSLPVNVPACDVETPLKNLAAVASSADSDDAKVLAAVEAYSSAARCISKAGASDAFGQKSGLQGGETLTFQKTLDRVRAAVKKK